MRRTPLYDTHVAMGGRMVEFAGYELPVQYPTGPFGEHQAVRTAAGLFDIDHMGQFELTGLDAELFLQLVQVWDIDQMAPLDAHYSLLLYSDGTVVDDIFLYKLPNRWLVVVNASDREKDFEWMQAQAMSFEISLVDKSDELCMLALHGPKAEQILQRMTKAHLNAVATRTALEFELDGFPAIAGRTGYTGEDGFELYIPAEHAVTFWNNLLACGKEDGLLACGLAARDSLRFEACMPLYGHEVNAATNPLEARLGWTVSWTKDFLGRDALLKVKLEKPQRLLVSFEMVDKAVAREHYDVAVAGQIIGHVTSGMKSPTLDKFLGMALAPESYSALGTEFDILVRGQPKKARVVKRPFCKPHYKKSNHQEKLFMAKFKVDQDARYAPTHEWVRVEDGIAVVGVSDYAQDSLSDVVFVELPEVGDTITAGKAAATVESVKAAEDVIAPISGEIIEINSALQDTPEIVNDRPYDAWFFRVKPSNLAGDLANLLDAAAYEKHVDETAH